MRLPLRRTQPLEQSGPMYDPGRWGPRIAPIGRALDAYQTPLRDIAISVAGSTALVVALSWQSSRYRSGWVPVDFGLVLEHAPSERFDQPPSADRWEGRVRLLGHELDGVPGVTDPLILAMDDGFVVIATANGDVVSWEVAGQ